MNFVISRDVLLRPLLQVINVVERRQTLPILANILLDVQRQSLTITATDLEVELIARAQFDQPAQETGKITLPGRKLLDICRVMPEGAAIELFEDQGRVVVRSGRSRFILGALPADAFPVIDDKKGEIEFASEQRHLQHLLDYTAFAMAQQDVRYYLNGMLLEVNEGMIRTVATDGHRLAMNSIAAPIVNNTFVRVIIPYKGVVELTRLLKDEGGQMIATVSESHLRINGANFTFTSKLIDAQYPDYEKVLPKEGDKVVIIDRDVLKEALQRTAILSNEKSRGVRLQLRPGLLRAVANNPEHEESEEKLSIDYQHENLDITFNVNYLIDILNTIKPGKVRLTFNDPNSSILIEENESSGNAFFVIMPMCL